MADHGDICRMHAHPLSRAFRATHTDTKAPTSVDVTITGCTANAALILTRKDVVAGLTRASAGGTAHFYDLDDSDQHLYYAHETDGSNAWSISVENQTVVVTSLASGGTTSYAWISG